MCVERVQRLMMVIFLGLIMYCYTIGLTTIATILGLFMMSMLLSWAFKNFCPSIWALEKFLPKCWS